MSTLKLEVFESDKPIEPVVFYVYKLEPTDQGKKIQQIMRSAAGKISSRTKVKAFTDDRRIFTTSKLDNLNAIDNSLKISFEQEEKLNIQENKKIYSNLAEHCIKERLREINVKLNNKEYKKYKIGNDVTTPWIFEINQILSSGDKQFRLRRLM